MMRRTSLYLGIALVGLAAVDVNAQYKRKTLVAHRGASAYAPENTRSAYRLAIEQGANFVDQDLQITKDGVLVCLHDLSLERTTNVEEMFPSRFRTQQGRGGPFKTWSVSDFTLAEIKRLDAGSWFSNAFKNERVLTAQEAIDLTRGKAGLLPRTRALDDYGSRGFDMEQLVVDLLKKNGLAEPGADPNTPVIIQSFSADSLKKIATISSLPRVLLVAEARPWLTRDGLTKLKQFAAGIGPSKTLVAASPEIVRWAHDLGLSVTARMLSPNEGTPGIQLADLKGAHDEMANFLYTFDVDAVVTDYPDQFRRR